MGQAQQKIGQREQKNHLDQRPSRLHDIAHPDMLKRLLRFRRAVPHALFRGKQRHRPPRQRQMLRWLQLTQVKENLGLLFEFADVVVTALRLEEAS